VLAGVPFFTEVFTTVGCEIEWLLPEGALVDPATVANGKVVVAKVTGPCRAILMGERTALNILTRASGIATQAKHAVELARALGWGGHVAGTRKTTPGFRLVEKYALLVAGASTHRHDLSQMVMLKGKEGESISRCMPRVGLTLDVRALGQTTTSGRPVASRTLSTRPSAPPVSP
jgi:nicotinate-nucleotide pyrophosphorylase (carboxylating)